MDDPSVIDWIASLPAGPASLTPSPESGAEPRTSDGSGATSREFSTKQTPRSSLEKTYRGSYGTPIAQLTPAKTWMSPQQTLLAEWEPFCGIWPKWGLLLSGEVYELPKWEPVTVGCESSYWPTSQHTDGSDSARHTTTTGVMHPGTSLTDAIRDWWPTSRAEDSESTGAHRGKADTLTSAVELWLTPKSPTGGSQQRRTTAGGGLRKLEDQAEFWPSPAARDYRSPNLVSYQERSGTTKGEQLVNFVEHMWRPQTPNTWPTPDVMMADIDGSKKRTKADRTNKDTRHGESLHHVAWDFSPPRYWPTPLNAMAEGGVPRTTPLEYNRLLRGNAMQSAVERFLAKQAEHWGTPRVGMERLEEVYYDRGEHNVEEQAGAFRCSPPAHSIQSGLTFWQRVRILLPLCRQLRRLLPSHYKRARSIFKRKLNPDFTDWLQGLPTGYTSDEFDSSVMEIWLSHCRRQLHLLCSQGERG